MGGRLTRPRALPLRTVVFWVHLAAGVTAGLVVLVMSVTGVLLAYERQVGEWAARRYHAAPPSPGAPRLPLDTLLARARPALGGREVVSVLVRSDSAAPVAMGFENRQSAFVDPYTAAVVGDDARPKAFFAAVQRWHRWLALGSGARSPLGKGITGAANLAFLFLVLSGLYLWWPRQLSARAFRAVALFVRGARGKARDWNWHHVLGIWSAPVLVLIVASATFISYAWPGKLVQRALGEPVTEAGSPERGERSERGARGAKRGDARDARRRAIVVGANLDSIQSIAAHRAPDWESIQLRFPQAPKRPITVMLSTGGARPDHRAQGTFDATSGAPLEWQTYADGSPFRRFRSWVRPIHTGEAGGIVGQTIAALASAAAAVLVWTGLALALRRLRSALDRRAKAPELRQAA